MDYLFRKKLYSDSTLKSLHSQYLKCVSEEFTKAVETNNIGLSEFCLEPKKNYYNHLHDKKKVEHDNIIRYYESVRKIE